MNPLESTVQIEVLEALTANFTLQQFYFLEGPMLDTNLLTSIRFWLEKNRAVRIVVELQCRKKWGRFKVRFTMMSGELLKHGNRVPGPRLERFLALLLEQP